MSPWAHESQNQDECQAHVVGSSGVSSVEPWETLWARLSSS